MTVALPDSTMFEPISEEKLPKTALPLPTDITLEIELAEALIDENFAGPPEMEPIFNIPLTETLPRTHFLRADPCMLLQKRVGMPAEDAEMVCIGTWENVPLVAKIEVRDPALPLIVPAART